MNAARTGILLLATSLAAAAGSTAPLDAQQPATGRGPALLTLPASTRALGIGNAFTIGSTDSDAVFYNAAFADRLRGAGAAVGWFGSSATFVTMSAGVEWWRGGLGIGVRALDHGLPVAPPTGERARQADEASLHEPGTAASERAATVAYARTIRGMRVGVTGHVIEQRVADERNVLPAADIALGMQFGFIAAGLAARSIGPSYELGGADVQLPISVALNAAATNAAPVGPFDLLPALFVMWEADEGVTGGGGVELSYWPVPGRTFSLRLGARDAPDGVRPFTAGAGFTGDRIILDYALVPYDDGATAHRIGIRWR